MSAIQLQIGYSITSLELQYKWEGQFLSLLSKNEHFILKDKNTDIQANDNDIIIERCPNTGLKGFLYAEPLVCCLLYTSDAADDLLCVDFGGRRIIKKKRSLTNSLSRTYHTHNCDKLCNHLPHLLSTTPALDTQYIR